MVQHKRKSNRLKDFNYSSSAWYFVTICVKDRKSWFGKEKNGKIELNNFGKLIKKIWLDIPVYYSNVEIDEFVIMPNHIHGILFINGEERESLKNDESRYGQLSKIIKSLKEAFTKAIKTEFKETDFKWQRSYYDHIIRNEKSLNKIRQYIRLNPVKWHDDKENSKGIWM
jgi:putative transposase